MAEYNEQQAMQGTAQRFVQAAEELRLTGRQLFRDGIVSNDQVLSKIKYGWQKPPKKAIELFCQKYGVSAAWMYTGDGNMYLGRKTAFGDSEDERPFFNTGFESCLDNHGELLTVSTDMSVKHPTAGDIDFWCVNKDDSLAPEIKAGDDIALKRLTSWKDYIAGNLICVIVTNEYKILCRVENAQGNSESIRYIQIVDGKPVESMIPKDIIVEIYKVVGNYRRH